jgi:PAS domain S-box-containing protein
LTAKDQNEIPVPGDVPPSVRPRAFAGVVVTGLVLAAAIAAAVAGVFSFIGEERARELRAWQTRLAIVADSRAGAVARWFSERVAGELSELAANESLQIYMTELALAEGARAGVTAEPAQAGYLRNLLVVTAERAGFSAVVGGPEVPANVRRIGIAGIGLYDMNGRALAATPAMPPLDGALGAFFAGLVRGNVALLDLYRNDAGTEGLGYAVPVYRVQGSGRPSEQVGWILGVRPVGREVFALLAQPGEVGKTAENILLRHRGPMIEYLSPLADGTPPLARSFADNTPGLAAAAAVQRPGGFVVARDYREREVLAVSRPVAGLPWLLVSKIDRAEALGATESRLRRLLVTGLLAVALGFALVLALWRHGASRRASEAARRHADMARRFDARGRLLRLVTDSQPNAIYMVDADGHISFANAEAARRAGISAADMAGKGLTAVFGPAAARARLASHRRALETGAPQTGTLQEDGGRVIQTTHVPLPAEGDGAAPAVLVVENDVTDAVTERARRERTLNQMVATLMAVVDKRDPYAGHQSERTSALARAIAEEMQADPVTVQTAAIAGSVMNIGKILVPAEVLTRSGGLSADEIQRVRESLQESADLLADVEFDGPVVETLRQLQERWDGSGEPGGLKGEAILLPARIVAAANAFVAMVSPRAWRAGSSVDDAINRMMGAVGTAFDRRVVAALVNYLDNRGGRAEWDRLAREPKPR